MVNCGLIVTADGKQPSINKTMMAFAKILHSEKQFKQYSSHLNGLLKSDKETAMNVFLEMKSYAGMHYDGVRYRKKTKK